MRTKLHNIVTEQEAAEGRSAYSVAIGKILVGKVTRRSRLRRWEAWGFNGRLIKCRCRTRAQAVDSVVSFAHTYWGVQG